jgi:hypothetical protein
VTERELVETIDAGVVVMIAGFGRLAVLGMTAAGRPITIVVEEREGELWMVTARNMAPLEEVLFVAEEGHDDED